MHNVLQNTQEEELNSTQIHNKHDHQKTQWRGKTQQNQIKESGSRKEIHWLLKL